MYGICTYKNTQKLPSHVGKYSGTMVASGSILIFVVLTQLTNSTPGITNRGVVETFWMCFGNAPSFTNIDQPTNGERTSMLQTFLHFGNHMSTHVQFEPGAGNTSRTKAWAREKSPWPRNGKKVPRTSTEERTSPVCKISISVSSKTSGWLRNPEPVDRALSHYLYAFNSPSWWSVWDHHKIATEQRNPLVT